LSESESHHGLRGTHRLLRLTGGNIAGPDLAFITGRAAP